MRASARRWLPWIATAVLLAACERKPDPPPDRYLADLRERLRRLQPEVEREIGKKLRAVELVVLPRERVVEESIPHIREKLARIENGPTGAEIEAEARAFAEAGAESWLACVDPQGRIIFPDPGDPDSLLWLVLGFRPTSDFAKDPRATDLLLLHELVHVHQHWHLETPAFHASARSRADLLARSSVLEGHAEYLTRRIATRIGLADLYAKYLARAEPPSGMKDVLKEEHRVAAADQIFAYRQGEKFVAYVAERLGYDEAMRRIFKSPPTLAAISRPELYFAPDEPSSWGPVAEDLRRGLTRERGQAILEVIALPMVREMTGEAADGFREGFKLKAGLADVIVTVLVAEDDAAARRLHVAWTSALERFREGWASIGAFGDPQCVREPDNWVLQQRWIGYTRQNVVRSGNLVVDVFCFVDTELERGAEGLADRAVRMLTDASWRDAWIKGDPTILKSTDAGLRLGAVSRMRRFVPDEDWEVRWLGRFHEAADEKRNKAERIAALVGAAEDTHPAVVARGLRALMDLSLYYAPPALLRERLEHPEAAVRRAAWALVGTNIGDDADRELPSEEVLDLVRAAFDDTDVLVRLEAADCLSKFDDEPGLVEVFRKALKDEHPRVRQEALIVLSSYGFSYPELLPEIVALLDERPDVASEALATLGPAAGSALPRLREVLEGPKGRAEAAWAIWRVATDPEPLLSVVRDSVAKGSPDGIEQVGRMGSIAQPVVPEVASVLANENRWARITAATSLGRIGGPEAREALEKRLEVERHPKVVEEIRQVLEAWEKPAETRPKGPR